MEEKHYCPIKLKHPNENKNQNQGKKKIWDDIKNYFDILIWLENNFKQKKRTKVSCLVVSDP